MTAEAPRAAGVAGLLLTGGRSRRMGRDKATLVLGGETLARRLGRLLGEVAGTVLEVGPGRSGLEAVRETPPFGGPLAALAAGWRALVARGHTGPVLVLACDLPAVDAPFLRLLAGFPGDGSVVPVVDGHRQLLVARWSAADAAAAVVAHARGETAPRGVPLGDDLVELHPEDWATVAGPGALADCDTPEDLVALGIAAELPEARP